MEKHFELSLTFDELTDILITAKHWYKNFARDAKEGEEKAKFYEEILDALYKCTASMYVIKDDNPF